jgi:hypothetical protein
MGRHHRSPQWAAVTPSAGSTPSFAVAFFGADRIRIPQMLTALLLRRAGRWFGQRGYIMKLAALMVSGALVATGGATMAHHSFAMFDQENPTELEGVVREFKYTNPHSYLLLEVKGSDGSSVVWNLEGQAPSLLTRDGWSSQTLKSGDELKLTIEPLHSGAPGGRWFIEKTKFKDGRPIRVTH